MDVRAARPDDELAALLRMPNPVLWARYCGGAARAERVLRAITPKPGHTASYEVSLVATDGGAVVGVLAGYPGAEEEDRGRRFARLTLPRIPPWHWRGAYAILRSAERLREPTPPEAFYVDALAVVPGHRRRGIAGALLEAGAERARAAGARTLALDTDLDNTAAQALYAARGFTRGRELAYAGDRYVPGPGNVTFSRTL